MKENGILENQNENQLFTKEKILEIKDNRKIMNNLLKNISTMKNNTYEELIKYVSEYLLNNSKDICELYDEEKNTLAHFLTIEEKEEQLKIIIDSYYLLLDNKDIFYKWFMLENKENLTILDIACQKGNKIIIKYLFSIISKTDESKLRLTEKRNSIFHNSAKNNQTYPIIFFYEKLQKFFPQTKIIDLSNEYNITPLHYACYYKSKNVIDLLLDLDANINAKDLDDRSILYYAVYSGSENIIKKLLFRGADKEIKDKYNKKVIDYAIEKNNKKIIYLLSEKNCFEKLLCRKIEYKNLKGIRYDYTLIYYFLIYIIFMLIFVFRIAIMFNKGKNSFDKLLIYNILFCGVLFFILSIMSFLFSIFFTCYFICYQKKKKKKINQKKSLIQLYEENENSNICVKCKSVMKNDTVHCLVCGICIDKWDHHCFWLNTCINNDTKNKFKLFYLSIILTLLFNILFGVILIIFSYKANEKEQDKIFSNFFGNFQDYINNVLLFKIMCIIYTCIFSFPLLINIVIPLCCQKCSKKENEDSNISDFETRLLNPSNESL